MSDNYIPADWSNSAQLDGLDLVDKLTLVDVPFRILGVSYRTSSTNNARLVEVDAERADGTTFSFNDSSTGVKEQISGYLASIGKDHAIEIESEYVEFTDAERLVVPKGLRVSEYEIDIVRPDGRPTGAKRKARTFYLTTSGERAGRASETPVKPAKRTARPASQ